jgi:DNA-binding response OmpR family regulator
MADVLVADRDASVRTLIRAVLALDGHVVVEAEDGDVAWNHLRSQPPHVMTLDLALRNVDGLTLLRRLTGHPTLSRVAVVVITGLAAPTDIIASFDAGAAFFLAKPFSIDELRDVVRRSAEATSPLPADASARWERRRSDAIHEAQLQREISVPGLRRVLRPPSSKVCRRRTLAAAWRPHGAAGLVHYPAMPWSPVPSPLH